MAVIESKLKRRYWENAALAFIPDLLIAWVVMKYNDGGPEAFFFTLVGLQVVYFLLWAKKSIWSWTAFALTNRSFMSNHIEEVLIQQKFPPPPDFMAGPDSYYQEIVDNRDEDCEIRIKAAQELGALAGVSVAGQHQLAIQLRMAMEDALQRYAKRPPPVPNHGFSQVDEIKISLSKDELDTLAWLADYGFRLVIEPGHVYHKGIDQISYREANAYSSLIDKFERQSVPNLLAEDEEDKERRFNSQQNRHHAMWSCYPDEK